MTLFDPNAEPDTADVYHIRIGGDTRCAMHTISFADVASFVAAECIVDQFKEVERNVWETTRFRDGAHVRVTKTEAVEADTWLD